MYICKAGTRYNKSRSLENSLAKTSKLAYLGHTQIKAFSSSIQHFQSKNLQELLEQNRQFVPTNATLHNCTGSSCNTLLLGSSQQSIGSIFYIMPYPYQVFCDLQCLLALKRQCSVCQGCTCCYRVRPKNPNNRHCSVL